MEVAASAEVRRKGLTRWLKVARAVDSLQVRWHVEAHAVVGLKSETYVMIA